MASPPSSNSIGMRIHHPKNVKAATEIKEDPELWRDIQTNVRKMDDLYDATFYSWLRSEDNVLVTASYLQRLAAEYDLDRIEHALCWLVTGWQLESIAILVKQVTFDWVVAKGDQGELNRAKLVLALTDNWGIQYIARLACTLLTSATASLSTQPYPMLKSSPCYSRMSPLPGSPISSSSPTMTSSMLGQDGYTYGSLLTSSPRPSTPPLSTRSAASSSPPSPSPSFTTSPVLSTLTPQATYGRRMAVSRRLGSPMHMSTTMTVAEDATRHLGRPSSAASPAGFNRTGHFRQTSSTLPAQQQRQRDHNQLGVPTSTAPLSDSPSTATSTTPAASGFSPQMQASYHPHHCNLPHHHHQHQQQQQQQQQHQHPHRGVSHVSRGAGSHPRQQSQPGTISLSKQQSAYSSSPVFYMNKSLFMEELSRKWSFCRLSEFFQFMDPASGINHRFKCKLLKESALKEESSQKQQSATSNRRVPTSQQPKSNEEQSKPVVSNGREAHVRVEESTMALSTDQGPLDMTRGATDKTGDIDMVESDPREAIPSSSDPFQAAATAQTARNMHGPVLSHPYENTLNTPATATNSNRTVSVSAPINAIQPQLEQNQYHPIQSFTHSDYNDDMNSGLNRGFKPTEGCHQHCRSQTVEAIMSGGLGITGSLLNTSSSSCSSSASSPTSTSAASASLSTLTLTESGMESSARPLSQPQPQQHQPSPSLFNSNFSTAGLYRHHTTVHSASTSSSTIPTSSTSVATSSSATTLSIHANANQRHTHDSTSTKRKNSLGVSLASSSHCSSFSATSSSSAAAHASADTSMPSSSAIFPGARRTSTSTSTTNEDLKRLRCSRQNSTSSTSGI
ncbi:hypothetical protein BGX27_002214 [Mortierella sp. AM989]|nr:hypothetical protein BGX27_002214 [Mortierella sp. AM989]